MSTYQFLFRFYRPMMLWFALILVSVEAMAVTLVAQAGPLNFSFWLLLAGVAVRYWVLVVGIMLVGMNFRQFVTNGVTRREFVAGVAVFGLMVCAGLAVLVVAGHALESALLGLADHRAASYPVLVPRAVLGEVGQVLPCSLAYLTSGALIAAGFYRFRQWVGVALILPSAVPIGVADGFLGNDEYGGTVRSLLYWPALAAALLAIAAAAYAFHLLMRDLPIRRSAG